MFGFFARTTALMPIVLILNSHCIFSCLHWHNHLYNSFFRDSVRFRMWNQSSSTSCYWKNTYHWRRYFRTKLWAWLSLYTVFLPFSSHLWWRTCLVQLSTTLPTDQYMVSNYTPTAALVITSLFGDYVIIHHSNHHSVNVQSEHLVFNVMR